MKAVMYHYVRGHDPDLPSFTYLHREDFAKQLDSLMADGGIVSRQAFFESLETGQPVPGHVLTFDDGFADHLDEVVPALLSRGLWGLFFIPVGPYLDRRLLDVHRIHMLLGRLGSRGAAALLNRRLDEGMLDGDHVTLFRDRTYWNQTLDQDASFFKNALNYYISYEHRGRILHDMMTDVFGDESAVSDRFYIPQDRLPDMVSAGMVVGSHSVSHPVFSKLPVEQQAEEINRSFDWLEHVIGEPVTTFCYPYGGFHSFTADTERLLIERGCKLAFNVESRDIAPEDLLHRPTALPRYDCNEFPHGAATRAPRAEDKREPARPEVP